MKQLVRFPSIALLLLALAAPAASRPTTAPEQLPARRNPLASEQTMLAATRAGQRLVAVGDHGTILLSDDNGKSFRQASSVPTRVTLNSVSFADDENGWAAGHWGTILHSTDGGEHWTLQRSDVSTDRPLFAVLASDADHVVAVGLWSLVLVSEDGGQSWQEVELPAPPDGGRADRNLLGAFAHGGSIFVAAEQGLVLRTEDRGNTWRYIATGYNGSFWTGIGLRDGTLLVGGLRGTIYRSTDDGNTWQAVDSGTKSSISSFTETDDSVVAVALDGVVLRSTSGGASFNATQRDDHISLTAVVTGADGEPHAFSRRGVVADLLPPARAPLTAAAE